MEVLGGNNVLQEEVVTDQEEGLELELELELEQELEREQKQEL